jgi:hypothetical protein
LAAELFEPGRLHQPLGGEADHLIGHRKRFARQPHLAPVRPARRSRAEVAEESRRDEARLACRCHGRRALSGVSASLRVKLELQAIFEKSPDLMTQQARNLTKAVEIDDVLPLGAGFIAHLKQLNRFRAMSGRESGQLVRLARFHVVLATCTVRFFFN